MRTFLLGFLLVAALAGAPAVLTGCGGRSSTTKKKKKKKKKEKDEAAEAMVDDPRLPLNISAEDKDLVLRLGALSEEHYGPAMETLRGRGAAAIVPLCWGLKFPLQNLRTRCVQILSGMKPSKDMISGCLNALGVYRSDVSKYEAPLRRWAMEVLARFHEYGVYTMPPVRRSIELDHDPGVRVLAGFALVLMGHKDGMDVMIRNARPIDWASLEKMVAVYEDVANPDKVRIDAMKHIEQFREDNGIRDKGNVLLETWKENRARYREAAGLASSCVERLGGPAGASYEDLQAWWEGAKGSFAARPVSFPSEPEPVVVPVKQWEPPPVQLLPMAMENIESDLREADQLLAQGDKRRAAGVLRRAFKESRNTRLDIFYRHFDVRRQLGPDHADKCYNEIRSKVVAWDPLNVKFRLLVARCAIDFQGWKEAKEAYEMVLILDPDNAEAKAGIEEMNRKLGK